MSSANSHGCAPAAGSQLGNESRAQAQSAGLSWHEPAHDFVTIHQHISLCCRRRMQTMPTGCTKARLQRSLSGSPSPSSARLRSPSTIMPAGCAAARCCLPQLRNECKQSTTTVHAASLTWSCSVLQVSYSTDNFLVKNRDFVVAEHQLLLENSSETFIKVLFPPEVEAESAQVPHSV